MKIGILGSSFNPPTRGHEDVVNQGLAVFDKILLVPSILHPFGKESITLYHRLEMLRLFIEPWQQGDPPKPVKVFNIEALILAKDPKKEKITTFDVLSEFEQYYQSMGEAFSLQFILGPDNADPAVWKKFYQYEVIEKRWGIWVAKENLPIRSTDVRDLVANQKDKHQCYQMLLEKVSAPIARYIIEKNLYKKDF